MPFGQEEALLPEGPEPMPIVFDGQTVAIIYSAVGVGTIEERAGGDPRAARESGAK